MQSDNLIFSAQYQQDQICSKICMKEKNSSETLLLAAQVLLLSINYAYFVWSGGWNVECIYFYKIEIQL